MWLTELDCIFDSFLQLVPIFLTKIENYCGIIVELLSNYCGMTVDCIFDSFLQLVPSFWKNREGPRSFNCSAGAEQFTAH